MYLLEKRGVSLFQVADKHVATTTNQPAYPASPVIVVENKRTVVRVTTSAVPLLHRSERFTLAGAVCRA